MITKMKKYTFLVFHREYEEFLSRLRDLGVLHVSEKAEGIATDGQLLMNMQLSERLVNTISKVEACVPVGSNPHEEPNYKQPEQLMSEFNKLVEEKDNIEQSIADVHKEQRRMQIWGDFSSDKLKQIQDAGWSVQFYSCSAGKYDEEWESLYNAVVVAQEGKTVYFVTVNKDNEVFDIGLEEIHINEHSSTELQRDIDGLRGLLAAKQAQLEAWSITNLYPLRYALRQTQQSLNWERVTLSTTDLADASLKLLEGFCPIDKCEALNKMLDENHIYYMSADPTEEDNTPVQLRNNWFTRMFEVLTGMYGWPVYGEFDPTPILGPFFLLFFALCMGDAGYGILLILFGILTMKKILNISMFEGLGPIITTLGVGTLVVGFFLGTFFGIDLSQASWVPDALKGVMIKGKLMGYDIQMLMALAIGVFHICLAMVIKAICYTKRFGIKKNITTWGWLLLVLGGLVTAILFFTEVFSAEVTKWVLIGVGGLSALAIYIFNTPGRNPLINIGAGLWETYNMATGILGDVLSYIRLYALGLAGGMLGAAFNQLAQMVLGDMPNIGQWIGFILILIIGHVLNLCMSALGAFVHPLRLSFVEYFKNSGYEGKGHLYEPFRK